MDSTEQQQRFANIAKAFNEFNNWVPCRKGVFILTAILITHICYWLCFELVLYLSGDNVIVDAALVRGFLWLWIGFLASGLIVAIHYAHKNSNSLRPFNIVAYIYTLFTMLFCHGFGFMDSVYSAFILLMVLGILILEPKDLRAAILMLSAWAVMALGSGIAVHYDWLDYAPFIIERSFESRSHLGWYLLSYLWVFQSVLMIATWVRVVGISRQHAVQSLEQNNQLIRRYVPPAVAERIAAGDVADIDIPQRRRVTMLHSDVVSFTQLADRLEPEALTEILSTYLGAMAKVIEKHNGTLCEYSGDGILAIFGAPNTMEPEDQVAKAVAAARAMHSTIRLLNIDWKALGVDDDVLVRIGINTGRVSVGSFGSQGRMTYTAIGLQANVTARIQYEAPPGGIIISDRSQLLLDNKHATELVGHVAVKGIQNPLKIHSVIA